MRTRSRTHASKHILHSMKEIVRRESPFIIFDHFGALELSYFQVVHECGKVRDNRKSFLRCWRNHRTNNICSGMIQNNTYVFCYSLDQLVDPHINFHHKSQINCDFEISHPKLNHQRIHLTCVGTHVELQILGKRDFIIVVTFSINILTPKLALAMKKIFFLLWQMQSRPALP